MSRPFPKRELSLSEGFTRTGLSFNEVWMEYLVMGGGESRRRIRDVVDGYGVLDPGEHNMLAAALNEHFVGIGENHPVGLQARPTSDASP